MKAMIVPVVALVVGIAGGTGARLMLSRKAAPASEAHAPAAADSAHATHAEAAHAAEPEPTSALPASVAEAALAAMASVLDSAAAKVRTDSTAAHAGATATAATAADEQPASTADSAAARAAAVADAQPDTTTLRLARIFGAMRPEDAARLLEPIDDVSLRRILLALSDRKAAAILAKFKGERSATLARALTHDGAH